MWPGACLPISRRSDDLQADGRQSEVQSEAGWDNEIATHLDSTFLLSKLAAASMVTRKRGKIINLASMYSTFGAAALPSYGAVKGAIVQLTKAMTVDLASHGIQVNAIAPGWIATEMTAMARDDPDWASFNSLLMTRTPAGRWGEADECAGAAVFLASPAADFVTGIVLPVDGDYSVFRILRQLSAGYSRTAHNPIAAAHTNSRKCPLSGFASQNRTLRFRPICRLGR